MKNKKTLIINIVLVICVIIVSQMLTDLIYGSFDSTLRASTIALSILIIFTWNKIDSRLKKIQ